MAVRYVVYVSPTPSQRHKYIEVPRTQTTTTFEVINVLPDAYIFYVWVAYVNPHGQETFLSAEPVYTAIDHAFDTNPFHPGIERDVIYNADMKYYSEEIRRRNMAMLDNDGEDFHLYIRRFSGMPCKCLEPQDEGNPSGPQQRITPLYTEDMSNLGETFNPTETGEEEHNENKDPEYQGSYRCTQCYGTGVAGGYFPKLDIRARYGNIPMQLLNFEEQGVRYEQKFNSWTLWHPRLHERDFLVRVRTGERFLITEVGESSWRGIPNHQQFNAVAAPRTSIVYDVADENITRALQQENAWNVGAWSWSLWM
jgi:hypothetical protein